MITDTSPSAHVMPQPRPEVTAARHGPHEDLRAIARDLEAAFLAEMLKHAGFGEARDSFGGGIGEEQMTSLLRTEHANAIAAQGGIGLAESIFASLVRQAEQAP